MLQPPPTQWFVTIFSARCRTPRYTWWVNAAPHLLIVDDDREIRDLLSRFLVKHGYRVDTAADGRNMDKLLESGRFDLIVLDIMLPGEDGLSLCRRLRATSRIPIIMLTALSEETERIIGLEMGADDYLTKPFNPRELLARVKAVLRRTGTRPSTPSNPAGSIFAFGGWRLDVARRELTAPDGVRVELTAGEFDLLLAFVEHPRRVLTREQLLDLAKGRSAQAFDRSIDVQLSRLRRKIEADPKNPKIIKTVRSGGYIFTQPVERP
jgi:two-component system, OmpR family, response regulator